MFGGVQINGQDTNNIYKRVGDLTIASPSLSSIILKTNYGSWEAMRLNTTGTSINTSLYVSGLTIFNNNITCLSSLNVSGITTFKNSTTNFWYNSPGTYFTNNGFTSYFTLNANVIVNGGGVNSQPFITVYNRMWKNGANSAIDIKTFGNSNSGVNSDVLIRIDSGGDPTPGANTGTITYNINGGDRHKMTNTSFGINTGSNNPRCQLEVAGIANIHDNNPYAVLNNNMALGSLTIGGTLSNYGTATNWSSSTAGLMMECLDYTEIVVHDSGARLSSLMYYDGPLNRIRLGRNKGWGVSETQIEGTLIIAQDRWTLSSEFNQRFYFGNNSTTYYQGYGTDYVNAHEWRNRDGTAIMYIDNLGNFSTQGYITGRFLSINRSPSDFLGLNFDTSQGSNYKNMIYVLYATFTGYHRPFTEDNLFNKDEPQLFKDEYIGRIVISTGKIATDMTNDNNEWEIKYNKEGITVEDAIPMIELSRIKKDKRVFGVMGDNRRNNSRKERLIVNSVGEGGIWVCNSNGNIENGDYITSSDYLGYGEKQDDDLLHNYTVAKATINCDFELDSIYYNCIQLNDNIKIAFIACTYHCG
jgi:hypothetical protein